MFDKGAGLTCRYNMYILEPLSTIICIHFLYIKMVHLCKYMCY